MIAEGLCEVAKVDIPGMPQVVPANFSGLCVHTWPEINNAYFANLTTQFPGIHQGLNPDNVNYKTTRTHDYGWSLWSHIETAPGVYDWSHMDALVTYHKSRGHEIVWTLEGTPVFYAAAGDQVRTSTFGTLGGGAYPAATSPNGMTGLSNFINAIVTRYNTAGGAWGGFGNYGRGIDVIELWNEPAYDGTGYWWGTNSQLVDFGHAVKTAAKSVDAGVLISSPGHFTAGYLSSFLGASGAINTGVTGAALCDIVQFHRYCGSPKGLALGALSLDPYDDVGVGFGAVKKICASHGIPNVPIWVGETGFDWAPTTTDLVNLTAAGARYRYVWWMRQIMLMAAYGAKRFMSYSWETPYACFPNSGSGGMADAVTDTTVHVAGKTITRATYIPGGEVTLSFSDGSTFTV